MQVNLPPPGCPEKDPQRPRPAAHDGPMEGVERMAGMAPSHLSRIVAGGAQGLGVASAPNLTACPGHWVLFSIGLGALVILAQRKAFPNPQAPGRLQPASDMGRNK